jgi:predicted MFS family arabinose efflux permease
LDAHANRADALARLLLASFGNGGALATALALALVQVGFSGGQVALVGRVPLAVKAEVRSAASGLFTCAFWLGGALGTAVVAGLAGPLGLEAALASAAALPAAGALFALAAGTSPKHQGQAAPRNPMSNVRFAEPQLASPDQGASHG